MNIPAADSMVGEYLIYRGFTQTYKNLESEKNKDKTKQFEVTRIVESIFGYLQGYEIHHFVSLWDFLTKRFFTHLDADHLKISTDIKSELLKFYLINAIKLKAKEKVTEFFTLYSHEMLAENGVASNLRSWFVLPYVEQPQDDPEFSAYFSQRWSDSLRLTLTNFLAIVLRTAPPPKILLLERWFRSEAQQEIRSQLKLSFQKVDILVNKLERSEERLGSLREVIRDLVNRIQSASINNNLTLTGTDEKVSTPQDNSISEDSRKKNSKSRDLGESVCRLSIECSNRGSQLQALSVEYRLREILGKDVSSIFFGPLAFSETHTGEELGYNMEEAESNLIEKIQTWLKSLN